MQAYLDTAQLKHRTHETTRQKAEYLDLKHRRHRSRKFRRDSQEDARVGFSSSKGDSKMHQAQRLLGRMRAELEYRSLSELMTDLPTEMERLQRTCALATEAVTRRYFAGAEAMSWTGVTH